jgi:hypothetical protein
VERPLSSSVVAATPTNGRSCEVPAGRLLAEQTLTAPLGYNALALAGGRVYATLADGSAVCLGAKPAQ